MIDAEGCHKFNACIVFKLLHVLRRYRGTMIDAEGCYKFNVCSVFYTR